MQSTRLQPRDAETGGVSFPKPGFWVLSLVIFSDGVKFYAVVYMMFYNVLLGVLFFPNFGSVRALLKGFCFTLSRLLEGKSKKIVPSRTLL